MGHLYHGYVSHNQMVRLGFQSGMTAGSTGLCVALMAWWCPKTCGDDGGESTNLKHGMPISKMGCFGSIGNKLENTLMKFGIQQP